MKLYIGWHESDWLSVLAAESRLCWVLFLERVKTHGDGGSLKKTNYDDLAKRWNVGVENIRNMVKAATIDGAIEEDETHWHVTGWSEYQEDRTNADRQKRYRDRQKESGKPLQNVTNNALRQKMYRDRKKRNETGSCNGALQTERNVTGRGEERRIEEIPPISPKGDAEWLEFLAVYPARKGDLCKAKGRDKFKAILKSGTDPQEILAGVTRYSEFLKSTGKVGTEYVKQIPTFLNNRTWEEDFGSSGKNGSAAPNGKVTRTLEEALGGREYV